MTEDKSVSGPCNFKANCKTCRYASQQDRPSVCTDLDCEYYTPCKKCGANTSLQSNGHCRECGRGKTSNDESTIVRTKDGFAVASKSDVPIPGAAKMLSKAGTKPELDPIVESVISEIRADGKMAGDAGYDENHDDGGFTMPGTPPSGLNAEESKYYLKQWESYIEYYPDPTLSSTLHTIIVIELELLWITSRAANSRGEYEMELMTRRSRLTSDIKALRNSLPEEEASQISEKEASLSYAYEQYAEERAKNSFGGVDRVFTKDAVALNAALPFKTDLPYILRKLGYTSKDVTEVTDRVIDIKNLTPIEVAEAFGFPVRQDLAIEGAFSGADFDEDASPV